MLPLALYVTSAILFEHPNSEYKVYSLYSASEIPIMHVKKKVVSIAYTLLFSKKPAMQSFTSDRCKNVFYNAARVSDDAMMIICKCPKSLFTVTIATEVMSLTK